MDPSVFCATGGKKIAAKYKLLDHIKNSHDEIEYPCNDCTKTFIGKRKIEKPQTNSH